MIYVAILRRSEASVRAAADKESACRFPVLSGGTGSAGADWTEANSAAGYGGAVAEERVGQPDRAATRVAQSGDIDGAGIGRCVIRHITQQGTRQRPFRLSRKQSLCR